MPFYEFLFKNFCVGAISVFILTYVFHKLALARIKDYYRY